jgi:chromosome segregation ATPase
MWQIEIRRGDIREVERIKDVFVNLANAQEACKASRAGQLLKLVNSVEPAAEQLVAWLKMVSDVKGRHIHDLEDMLAAQAQRGDENEARCKDLEGKLKTARDAETRAAEKIGAVEERAASLQVELEQQAQRGDENEARCKDLDGKMKDMRGQLAEQRTALERAATAEEAAKARDTEARVAEARCKDLEGQLQDLREQLAEQRTVLERAATAAQQKLTEEAAKARDAEWALERAATVAQQKLTEEAAKARDAERRAATRCKDLEGQLQGLQEQVAEERAALERAATAAQQKLAEEAAKARDAERRAANLQVELETRTAENSRAAENWLLVENRAENLQVELEQLRSSFAFAKEEFANQRAYLEIRIRSLEQDGQDATARLRREQEELEHKLADALRDNEICDVEMKEAKAKCKALLLELHAAEREQMKLKSEIEFITDQTLLTADEKQKQLQQELMKMAAKYQSADAQAQQAQELRASVSLLEEELEQLQRSNSSLEKSHAQLLVTVEASEAASKGFQKQIADAQTKSEHLFAMKEDLERMVSGCRFEISRLEAATAKQKGVMEEMRIRELDMQTILQKREADVKGAAIDVDTEREQRILREQSCQALKRELACTKEQLTTAEDMRSRAELRLKQSEAERDRLLLDLERQKQFASSKASQLGHLEHQHFQSESRVAELEKRLEWERKAVAKLKTNNQELLLHVNDLKERVGDSQRKACVYADNVSALERELEKQRALAVHMCTSWRHSVRSGQRDAMLEQTLHRNGLLLSHQGTPAP